MFHWNCGPTLPLNAPRVNRSLKVVGLPVHHAGDGEGRIQLRLGDADLLGLGGRQPLGLPHVGAAAEQFGGNADGHFRRRRGNGPVPNRYCRSVAGMPSRVQRRLEAWRRSISSGRIWASVCARLLLACS